jgi:hypothetical protein
MKKAIIIVLLAITGSYGRLWAQVPEIITSDKTGWHKIGETTVDFKKEKDEIVIVGADRFASIKFKVDDAPIELVSMEVYFDKGGKQDIKVNMPIKAPGDSKEFELKGGEQDLKKVVFIYKTLPNRKDNKAHIELWGMKTNTNNK